MTSLSPDPMTDYLVERLTVLPNSVFATRGDNQGGEQTGVFEDVWWYYSSEWVARVREQAPVPGVPWADNIGYGAGFVGSDPVPNWPADTWSADAPHASAPGGVVVGSFEDFANDGFMSTYVELRSNVDGSTYAAEQIAHETAEVSFTVHADAADVDPSLSCQVVIEVQWNPTSGMDHVSGAPVLQPPTLTGSYPFGGGSNPVGPTSPYGQDWDSGGPGELYGRTYAPVPGKPYWTTQFSMMRVGEGAPSTDTVEQPFYATFTLSLDNTLTSNADGSFDVYAYDELRTRVYEVIAYRIYKWPGGVPRVHMVPITGEQQVAP